MGKGKGVKKLAKNITIIKIGLPILIITLIVAMLFVIINIIMGIVSSSAGFLVLYRPELVTGVHSPTGMTKQPSGGANIPQLLPGSRFYYMSEKGKFTSPFGMRNHPIYKSNRNHLGIDIGGMEGKEITMYPSRPGKVTEVRKYADNKLPKSVTEKGNNNEKSGAGQFVRIEHEVEGVKVTTRYLHMYKVYVDVGDIVNMDTPLGIIGTTGASTGPHIHFEMKINDVLVNPLNYLYCGGRQVKINENVSDCFKYRGDY